VAYLNDKAHENEKTVIEAFHLFDTDGDGYIT